MTEARNSTGREFGEDRLQLLLIGGRQFRAAELRDRIMGAVNEFSDGLVYDDATLMVVRVA